MINHARTLLLNKDGDSRPGTDFYLEEYVDPSFKALEYSNSLKELRAVLVGRSPDNYYLNFRLRQYMTTLHSTEFESYVYQMDPRVTYVGQSPEVVKTNNSYSPLNALATSELVFEGAVIPDPNKLAHSWRVSAIAPYVVRTLLEGTSISVDTLVTVNEGLTSPIVMAGKPGFLTRIYATGSLTVGAEWRVSSFVEPTDDLSDIPGLMQSIDPQHLAYIFPNTLPYSTFKELWVKQSILAYQLSGLLLAWVYRAEEERLNG